MRAKKVLFAMVAILVPSILLAGVAEFAVRWRTAGGVIAAIQSFVPKTSSSQSWLKPDPDLGYTLNPASDGVNSLGIRHREIGPRREGDPARILIVGDSVSFDREGYVELVRHRFTSSDRDDPYDVINASIPGYTTYQERIFLERDLLALDPDWVILQYCVNDNHRFLHELDEGGHWIVVPDAAGEPEENPLPRWLQSSYLVQSLQWRIEAMSRAEQEAKDPFPWRNTPEFGNAWLDESWPDEEAQIRAIRDATRRTEARLVVVAFPHESQLTSRALDQDEAYTLKPQRQLADIAARLEIPLLDLHSSFLEARRQDGIGHASLFRDGLHLTPAGHALAAREISRFIESRLQGSETNQD